MMHEKEMIDRIKQYQLWKLHKTKYLMV